MLLACVVLSAPFSCSSFKSLVFHVKHSHKVCRGINLVQPIRLCRFCLLMSFFSRCFPAYPVTALCFTWNVPYRWTTSDWFAYAVGLYRSFRVVFLLILQESCVSRETGLSMNRIWPVCLCCWLVSFFPRRSFAHPTTLLCFTWNVSVDEPHLTSLLMLLACAVLSAPFSCSSFKSLVFHVKHPHKACRGINLVQPIRLCRFCLLMSFFSRCFPAYPVTVLCFTWNVPYRWTTSDRFAHAVGLYRSFRVILLPILQRPYVSRETCLSMNCIWPFCLCCWLIPFFLHHSFAHPATVPCFT